VEIERPNEETNIKSKGERAVDEDRRIGVQ
jgi:hypothetical protein